MPLGVPLGFLGVGWLLSQSTLHPWETNKGAGIHTQWHIYTPRGANTHQGHVYTPRGAYVRQGARIYTQGDVYPSRGVSAHTGSPLYTQGHVKTPRGAYVERGFTRDLRLIKARVIINLPPGGPEGGGERYQHFEEIFGTLGATFFQS